MSGRVLADKFRLRRLIGTGGTGAVYEAEQVALQRTVAVKMLRPHLALDEKTMDRFRAEAIAVSRLNHPNTVSVIDYGHTSDGLLYLVLEHLRGPTLRSLLRNGFPFKLERIADTARQILAGLEEAHAAGVVHADLKPGNIIVEPRRASSDLVKVIDFGIARLVGDEQASADSAIFGTPKYIAPEVACGAQPTYASDVYSMGIVLYEMLTGAPPFAGDSMIEVLEQHVHAEPRRPSEVRPDLEHCAILEGVVLRALAKDPNERFESAREFIDAIDAAVANHLPAGASSRCARCGRESATDFNFCPECGLPRRAEGPASRDSGDLLAELQATARWSRPRRATAARLVPRQELAEIVQFVSSRDRGVARVVGQAGSGRSTLVGTACDRLAALHDMAVHTVRADPNCVPGPLYPLRTLIADVLDLAEGFDEVDIGANALSLGLDDRDLPGLAELFGHESALAAAGPATRRRELMASTIRALRAASQHRPTVIVFDDMSDYDPLSRDVIAALATSIASDSGLFVIGIERPAALDTWPPEAFAIQIGELETSREIPAAAHHAARLLADGGSVPEQGASLADLIATRLGLLPHSSLLLCQATAVFGQRAPRSALTRCLGIDAARFDTALDECIEHEYLFESGEFIGFVEAMVRDVVYDSTPADVRRHLHTNAAKVLNHRVADAATLGHHHSLGDNPRRAATTLLAAGDEAVAGLDEAMAINHYLRGLSAARDVLLGGDTDLGRTLFSDLSLRLARTLLATGEPALARGVVFEAAGDSTPPKTGRLQTTDVWGPALAELLREDNRDIVVQLYVNLCRGHAHLDEIDAALLHVDEALELVTGGYGPSATDAPANLWSLLLESARLRLVRGETNAGLALAMAARDHATGSGSRDGAASAHATLAALHEHAGDHVTAAGHRAIATKLRRELADRRGTAEMLLGPLAKRADMEEALQLSREVGWREGTAVAQRALALVV
jgi:serine/threonine-protein kinase